MEPPPQFQRSVLISNVSRVTAIVRALVEDVETVNNIFRWKYGFLKTLVAMVVWIAMCLYVEVCGRGASSAGQEREKKRKEKRRKEIRGRDRAKNIEKVRAERWRQRERETERERQTERQRDG
jgi:hypothetical protein